MFRKAVFYGAFAALGSLTSPAMAEWRVAETQHFTYYSEAPDDELRETVTELESFDKLVRALTGNTRPASPIKVTMFEVADMDAVNATFPYPSRGVGGYYSNTLEGPFLVTFRNVLKTGRHSARLGAKQSYAWGPEVRQHEYLHHYMYQYFNANYPSWYTEGFAEYYGTIAFPEPNVVEIGHAPYFRMDAIRNGSWINVKDLLTAKSYADVKDVSALYAQGWLLTHFAAQNPVRGKQLQAYLNAVATGTDYAEAAQQAFGDLSKLDQELRAHRKDINAMRLALKPLDIGAITIRDLSPLESDLMRYRIRLYSGFEYSDLPLIIQTVGKMREADPANAMGLEIQAQLENLAGKHAEALESAKALLTGHPDNIIGLTEKGKAMVGLLDTSASVQQWADARAPLEQAAVKSATAIEPRVALYQSYANRGLAPAEAQNRLVEAFNLLPQNDEIRYLVARDFEMRGMIEDAILIIKPAAFGTFDGDEGEKRKRARLMEKYSERFTNINNYESAGDMLMRLEAKRDGTWDEATQTIIGAS